MGGQAVVPESTDNEQLCNNFIVTTSNDFTRKDSNQFIMIHSNYNQNDICFKYDTCNVQNYSTDSHYNKNLYSVTDNDFFNSAGPGFEYDPQAGTSVSSVEEDTSCQGNYYNENFCSVTGSDFFNFAGPGFEYDPRLVMLCPLLRGRLVVMVIGHGVTKQGLTMIPHIHNQS